jgi:multiple RNA-binding domain-containing protein 1
MGFVTFASAESAIAAQRAMHRSAFQGRILHAVPAVSRRTNPELESKKSLKDQRLQKAKENASKDFNWSMLYMNVSTCLSFFLVNTEIAAILLFIQSDAVVSSVADRMRISKADILNPDSDGAAVKLALAETHVIQETKKYFEDVSIALPYCLVLLEVSLILRFQEGVVSGSFRSKQRSDTTILVKNIPYGTTISELTEMFSSHGEITRLLLPPAGTIAVVEFSNSSEAGKAFRAVAYRRLKNSIVYLEKGPAGMFKQDEPSAKRISSGVKPVVAPSRSAAYVENGTEMVSGPAVEESDNSSFPAGTGATLFIKNLNFGTTTDKLIKTFQHLPSFAFARVQMKPDPKRPGSSLSMGYGFVGFRDRDAAKKAMTTIDGFVLDGHSLIVKFAQRGAEDTATGNSAASAKVPTTKVVVKNLPFEATKKDIRTLFGSV